MSMEFPGVDIDAVHKGQPMKRTEEQEFANNFDMELEHLARKAEARAAKGSAWGRVAILLRDVRAVARMRMHDEDRRITA